MQPECESLSSFLCFGTNVNIFLISNVLIRAEGVQVNNNNITPRAEHTVYVWHILTTYLRLDLGVF